MEIQDKQTHKAVRNDSVFSFVNNVMQDWPVALCVIIDWQCVLNRLLFFLIDLNPKGYSYFFQLQLMNTI